MAIEAAAGNRTVPDEALRALGELGLTSREARAYGALLRGAPATAAEVAEAAGLARPKVYEALESLEQRGFCYARGDRVLRFHAVDPEVALHELARRRAQEREAATKRDERLVGELVAMLPRATGSDDAVDGRYMHAAVGADATLAMLVELMERAEHRLDIVVTVPVIQPRDEWHRSELRAIERGVSVRVIYARELVGDPERYQPLRDAGAEVRAAPELPLKMIVRDDGAEAIVALVDAPAEGELSATNVMMRHPALAAPFQLLFNRQWREAEEIAAEAA